MTDVDSGWCCKSGTLTVKLWKWNFETKCGLLKVWSFNRTDLKLPSPGQSHYTSYCSIMLHGQILQMKPFSNHLPSSEANVLAAWTLCQQQLQHNSNNDNNSKNEKLLKAFSEHTPSSSSPWKNQTTARIPQGPPVGGPNSIRPREAWHWSLRVQDGGSALEMGISTRAESNWGKS